MILGLSHIVLFAVKLIFYVPLKTLWTVSSIYQSYNPATSWNHNLWLRIFMREATSICSKGTYQFVLNPLFEWFNKWFLEPPSDEIQTEFPFRYSWFYKPHQYDALCDETFVFVHGGGYAIKMIPIELLFLRQLTKVFPRMAIMVHDYTVSVSETGNKSGKIPVQSIELIYFYKHLIKDIGCSKVTLMGESAGGHVILHALLLLQDKRNNNEWQDIPLPHKIMVVSPWCNPLTKISNGHALDSLSSPGLNYFTSLLWTDSLSEDVSTEVERDFDMNQALWQHIIQHGVSIYISYGTHETLAGQIAGFCNKLSAVFQTNKVSTGTGKIVIFQDFQGAHIEPVLHLTTFNVEKWSRQPNVAPMIDFLSDE